MLQAKPKTLTALLSALCIAGIAVTLIAAPEAMTEQTYAPDDGRAIANPERGLYTQFTSQAEQSPLELAALQELRNDHITLILRMYYLKTFRDQPLNEQQLDLIRGDFEVMREAGVKCILRFAYSEAIGEPDAPIDMVLSHMDQLAPILSANADVILTAQTGFVGAWGEGHASTNDLAEPENHNQIIQRWLDMLPASRTVQLRTPRKKWEFLGHKDAITPEQAHTDTPIARLGHHNDCFISSDTDVGTYIDIETEKPYLAQDTGYTSMGGETCALTKFAEPKNARADMAMLHFTYLNLGYHPEVIQMWREESFFKEVKNRLGYRLSLVSLKHPDTVAAGGRLTIKLELKNTGFAAPINPRTVTIVLASQDGAATYTTTLNDDPHTWRPGEPITVDAPITLPGSAEPGEYSVFLALTDPEPALQGLPGYAIQLANPGLWDPATGWHDLGVTIKVQP